MTLPEDLAIYLPRLGRSHPLDRYARLARFAPGSDEAIVLAAMHRARFSLWRVERWHPTTDLILRDLPRGEETWLVDEAGKEAFAPRRCLPFGPYRRHSGPDTSSGRAERS